MNNIIVDGSSKIFYKTEDNNVYHVVFKDILHGRSRQQEIKGTGRLREEFCFYFYQLLEKEGVKTHLASHFLGKKLSADQILLERGLRVKKLDMVMLELIARFVARGHWVDSHKVPVLPAGEIFTEPVIEFCLKWKKATDNISWQILPKGWRYLHKLLSISGINKILLPETVTIDDPRINTNMAICLHNHARQPSIKNRLIENREEGAVLKSLISKVNHILKDFLRSEGWVLEDSKFEVGIMQGSARNFIVADELTQDSSRIRNDKGESLTKDLHRQHKSPSEIYDGYAKLTEAIKKYAK